MFYLDTCVIIAYGLKEDPNHEKAVNVIEKMKKINGMSKICTSTLTLVELYSALSRNIQKYKLPPGIEEIVNDRIKLRATVAYLLLLLSVHIFPDDSELSSLDGLRLFSKFSGAISLSIELKLKTLDLLHIAYASELAKQKSIRFFITLDSEIISKKDIILKVTGIEIMNE
jgi:predicted nucleic acid-binding protein